MVAWSHDETSLNPEQPVRGSSERLRNGIAMAIILCAGIAGGVLLSSDFSGRAAGYESHAAEYLYGRVDDDPTAPAVSSVPDQAAGALPICEEYTKLVTIAGQSETIYGTACRLPDGTWDIVQ